MALAVAPFAAQAETWNIYGWQNHSWEFVDIDGGRSFDRIQSNAGNIGFAASVDTGMNGIHVNVQCEQFMYVNHFAGGTGWCNRNSKIGLSHPQMGEIMFATWLLPYNEGVAQWVDPFYDAGADSHTSIMGSVGANTIFYNTGDFDQQASASHFSNRFDGSAEAYDNGGFEGFPEFNYSGLAYDTGFNRRQENIIQYWSPNWNGFVFRFAWTAGTRDETAGLNGTELDPVIRSSSLAYTNGPVWAAVTWQDHEDWTAASISGADNGAVMETSDAESIRIAGRYIMDLGDGMSVQLSAMWEDLEYEFNGVTNVDAAMAAFGYGSFSDSYALLDNAGNVIGMTEAVEATEGTPAVYSTFADLSDEATDNAVKAQKTLALVRDLFYNDDATAGTYVLSANVQGDQWAAVTTLINTVAPPDLPLTAADESKASGCASTDPATCADFGLNVLATPDGANPLRTAIEALNQARDTVTDVEGEANTQGIQAPDLTVAVGADGAGTAEQRNAEVQYQMLVAAARDAAMDAFEPEEVTAAVPGTDGTPAVSAADNRAAATAGQNVKIERDAWMVSGKIKFGGPVDFRFSYMDADDLEVSCGAACSGDWDETAAQAWNVGMFYTMPGGTELRLTYSEVDNDDNGTYGQGISGTGLGTAGAEIEMFAVGIVHWFD